MSIYVFGILLSTAGFFVGAFANPSAPDSISKIWSLEHLKKGHDCWCIIRDKDTLPNPPIYHIEVVCRKFKEPKWSVDKAQPHMAITLQALVASIKKPLKKGDVYPEQYSQMHSEWKMLNETGKANICSTTVKLCILPQKK
jgi:hypothetical protein